jgi:ParB family transcriptional regulator, chromosome partitioning protein
MNKADELRAFEATRAASLGLGAPVGMPPGMSPEGAPRLPARLQGLVKSQNAAEIPVEKIRPDPDQPRQEIDPEGLDRLAESMKGRGQLQPVRVRWSDEAGAYIVIAGERRLRAAVQAGLKTLSCVIHDKPVSPAELLAMQLVENALREDLKPVEQARAYQKLMQMNDWSGSQLARELAVAQSAVSRALALLDLPEAVQDQVDAGSLPARTAVEIGKLGDAAEVVALAEATAAEGLSRDQVEATVKARRMGKAQAGPGSKIEFKFDDGGKLSITLPPGTAGLAAVLEMLQRGMKKVRAELKQAGPSQAA